MRLAESQSGYLFLDELTTSPPAVQAAMLAVALDRVVGDLTLPVAVRVVTWSQLRRTRRRTDGSFPRRWPIASCTCSTGPAWMSGSTGPRWAGPRPPASRAITADPARVETVKALVTGFIQPNLSTCTPSSHG